jgi:hypothetical protein
MQKQKICIFIIGVLLICACTPSPRQKTMPISSSDLLNMVSSEPMFWSRIGFAKDPTWLDSTGNPLFYDNNFDQAIKENREFAKAGVKVFTSILHNGWIGDNKYNYTIVDSTLDILLKGHPTRYYLPRIKLNVPIEWALKNPGELYVSFKGPRDRDEISELAKTMSKFWDTAGWSGNVPDNEGRVGLQSFSSKKWKQDAGEALIKLLKHIEDGPYAERIIGYQIAFGACGETAYWGAFNNRTDLKGDYGISNRKAFYDWCIENHGSLDNLRKVWKMPELDANNFQIPSPYLLESDNTTLESFFLADEQKQPCIDYNIFTSQMTAGAIDYFGGLVKENTGGKPVGVFYGYLFVQNATRIGHLAIDQLLNSPNIDFLASPKMYFRSDAGWPGGEQTPSLSIMRKKIWMDELDNPTHLNNSNREFFAKNMDETRTVLWREVAKNLAYNNQNFWWMDLMGGWFDNDTIIQEISKLYKVNKLVRERSWKSISDILYVIDDKSYTVTSDSYGLCDGHYGGIIPELETELKLTGASVETYRLCDLEDIPVSQYKLIVFANAFLFEKGQWERIKKRIPERSTIIWNYAAGIRNPDFAWENVQKVTGFSIQPCPDKVADGSIKPSQKTSESAPRPKDEGGIKGYDIIRDFPLIRIVPSEGQTVLEKYSDGSIMTAMRTNKNGGKVILCAYPGLKAEKLREIAKSAGCHMYVPVNCTVYGDQRFISVFPKNKVQGSLKLKNKCDLEDQITGTKYPEANEIPLDIPEKSAAFFLINPY